MGSQVVVHWCCLTCEVEGRDPEREPSCWNCGGEVTVMARPTVPMQGA
jgi:DNA-directed RNA polymerase subunit RPC12/RpoP